MPPVNLFARLSDMNSKRWQILVTIAALVAIGAAVWWGGGWLWHLLLAMHGRH
jgi:hypothetical protein